MNQSYNPYSSANLESFGSNLDNQFKSKFENPFTNEYHYVPYNEHVNKKKEQLFKRPQRPTTQRAKSKKIWVPKSICIILKWKHFHDKIFYPSE